MDSALDDHEPSHCSVLFTYTVGLSLVAAAVCLLLWNEHRAGALSKALDQALEQVVHIEEGQSVPTNSTRLIHITGQLSSRQVAIDEAYNVSVAAVKLRRLVEMYQWVEKSTYRHHFVPLVLRDQLITHLGGTHILGQCSHTQLSWQDSSRQGTGKESFCKACGRRNGNFC